MRPFYCALLAILPLTAQAQPDCASLPPNAALSAAYVEAAGLAESQPEREIKKRREGHVRVAYVVVHEPMPAEKHAAMVREIDETALLMEKQPEKICAGLSAIRKKYRLSHTATP